MTTLTNGTAAEMEAAYGGYENMFFSQKDFIRKVYSTLDCFTLILGLSLNSLLIYLIRKKTVEAMRIYSKLLTISCVMDLVLSIWNFVVQPIPVVDHGYRTVMMNGLFRNADQAIRYGVYLIWVQLFLFFFVTTMCQYVYRYCILCRDGRIPGSILVFMIPFCCFLYVFHACLIAYADYPREESAPKAAEIARLVVEETGMTEVSFIAFVNGLDPRWLVHVGIMCIILPGFYTVIVICSIKIRRAINAMNTFKLREYNNQVSAALLFQAILPSFEAFMWTLQLFVPIFVTSGKTVWYMVFTDVVVHLIPCINPMGTIMLVAPYRRAFLGYLGIQQAGTVIIRTYTMVLTRSRNTAVRPSADAAVVQPPAIGAENDAEKQ